VSPRPAQDDAREPSSPNTTSLTSKSGRTSALATELHEPPADNSSHAIVPEDDRAEHIAKSIEDVVRLETRDQMGFSQRVASVVTAIAGSMLFVWLNIAWFATWIIINVAFSDPFDPFPFTFLTMIVSLEAIFLSVFVLITQNRQALQADRRAKVDLEVNTVAEQEVTKLIGMVEQIHDHLGIKEPDDPELRAMKQPTAVEELADAVEEAEKEAKSAVK